MPTIWREHGLGFVIYIDDHPPAHVHVTGRGVAKIMLEPDIALVHSRGLAKADVSRALAVISERREQMIEAWYRTHG